MNLRLRDSSIRIRLSPEEVDDLRASGRVERETHAPGAPQAFRYAVAALAGIGESRVDLAPFAVTIVLASDDLSSLADPSQEGVTLRREWRDPESRLRRALIVVERDRLGERPSREESWIYDQSPSDDHGETA